jgi:streptogramin lyase
LSSPITRANAVHAVPLPTEAQGAAFDASGHLWITRSNHRFGELLRIDSTTGNIQARHAMPIGVEDLSFDGDGGLWTVSEAGSKRWLGWKTFFPVVFRLDVSKLQ